MRKIEHFGSVVAVFSAVLMAGCGDSEIKTYQVAKEDNQPPKINIPAGAPAARPELPHVHSDVPEGWMEGQPEGMRVAAYQVTGKNGRVANVAIIPLPGTSNIELQSVNMWREELQLDELDSEQLKEVTQPIEVGDAKGILVDMTASQGGANGTNRTLGAVAERKGIMWFVKMIGDSALVGSQKENFVAFVKSLKFHEGSHGAPEVAPNTAAAPSAKNAVSANTEKVPEDAGTPKFEAPKNWTAKAPGPMVQQAFTVKGENGEAEVTISKFPGEVGGMIANINRWRGQLGLEPLPQTEAQKSAEMVEVDGEKKAYLVDIKGTNVRGGGKPARLVAMGVPHKGETWFFKLLGDEAVVAKEKDTFVRFVVSAY